MSIILSSKYAGDVMICTVHGHVLSANGLSDVEPFISKTQSVNLKQTMTDRHWYSTGPFIYNKKANYNTCVSRNDSHYLPQFRFTHRTHIKSLTA